MVGQMTLLRPFKSIRKRTNCFLHSAQSWWRIGDVRVPRSTGRLRFIFFHMLQTNSCRATFWRGHQKWFSAPKQPNMFLCSAIHTCTNDWMIWGFSPSLKTPYCSLTHKRNPSLARAFLPTPCSTLLFLPAIFKTGDNVGWQHKRKFC